MIVITTQCFAPKIGGIESLMTGMAEAMVNAGKDLIVLADGPKNISDKNYQFEIKRFNAWKPIRRLQKASYLKKLIRQNKIEAVYADSWKSIEYVSNSPTKIIVLAHGTEIPKQYSNQIFNFFKYKKTRIISSYKNANKIIANSSYTKDLMQVLLNIKNEKIVIIHPGIDVYEDFISTSDQSKIKKIIKNRFPVITTLARVEKRKGHMYVLNALAEIKNDFPNIIYLVAGKGPYLKAIKEHSKKLGLQKNIQFLGWITEPEKSLILKNSNLFVMTPNIVGESVEGFGMSFIDASFHKLASVGTNSGGISDAIVDKKTGLLCEAENQKDITEKIKLLLSDDRKRLQMGINGKERAEKFFTWKNKIHEYLNII